MTYENIKLEIADQVATITLNQPSRMNACSLDMADEIIDALDKLEAYIDETLPVLLERRRYQVGAKSRSLHRLSNPRA